MEWAAGLEPEHHQRFPVLVNAVQQYIQNNPSIPVETSIETAYLATLAMGDLTTNLDMTTAMNAFHAALSPFGEDDQGGRIKKAVELLNHYKTLHPDKEARMLIEEQKKLA